MADINKPLGLITKLTFKIRGALLGIRLKEGFDVEEQKARENTYSEQTIKFQRKR